ncbi:MAG TPA: hypothetical protein VGW40_05025 [Allosphingosinicella sp.]|nr:hypothetical protein [Allosphingosinicella sp.]
MSEADSASTTLREPFAVFDSFLPEADAEAMRAAFDTHFSNPGQHKAATHQIWNYWYVPGLYTYLRTGPERLMPRVLIERFVARLTDWARDRLGLGHVTWPYLSLYVDGCGQGIHNDSTNGRFGFVYSLTRNDRHSRGGQTIVFKEGDPFRGRLTQADAGTGLYDLIEPDFNRLVLFDDRMPHGVQRIEGAMDPLDGRVVLHGHISEGDAVFAGPVPPEAVGAAVGPAIEAAIDAHAAVEDSHHGPLVVRLEISPEGRVSAVHVLVDRVVRSDGGDPQPLVRALLANLAGIRLPPARERSLVTLPILVGGLLPWMQGRAV